MKRVALIALLAPALLAEMTPVGAIREIVQYAIELPDERLCVLTSQRLALIEIASARQVTSSA